MGRGWIFQQDNDPQKNIKTKTKMGHWEQNQASAMAIPVPWPEPYRKWVGWTEEKHQHGDVNLKGLERFWMKEWSLISRQVFSKLVKIIGEDSELLSWQKEVAKSTEYIEYWRVWLIVANVNYTLL